MIDDYKEPSKPDVLDTRIARPDLWFYPGEQLGPDQIRVTLMGTGW
jgi:hypothetical protein